MTMATTSQLMWLMCMLKILCVSVLVLTHIMCYEISFIYSVDVCSVDIA